MKPLFSPSTELVAWIEPAAFVYDLAMRPVAFISNGHAFSYPDNNAWLGPVDVFTLLDRNGKPVAFNPDHSPRGSLPPLTPLTPLVPLRPLTPLTPLTPLRPLQPLTPLGGWSTLTFDAWLAS